MLDPPLHREERLADFAPGRALPFPVERLEVDCKEGLMIAEDSRTTSVLS